MHEKTSPQRELFPPREVPVDRMDEILRPENIIPRVAEEVQKAFVRLPPEFEGERLINFLNANLPPRLNLLVGTDHFYPGAIPRALRNWAMAITMGEIYNLEDGINQFEFNPDIFKKPSPFDPFAIVGFLIFESAVTKFKKPVRYSLPELEKSWRREPQTLEITEKDLKELLPLIRKIPVPEYQQYQLRRKVGLRQYPRLIRRNIEVVRNLSDLISLIRFIYGYENITSFETDLKYLGFEEEIKEPQRVAIYPKQEKRWVVKYDPKQFEIVFFDITGMYYDFKELCHQIELEYQEELKRDNNS